MTADDLMRKGVQVNLQVYETLTGLKHGNMTYNDVLIELFEKAGVPLKVMK